MFLLWLGSMRCFYFCFFFFNDTATTEIYTRSIVGSVRCVQETDQRRVHGDFSREIDILFSYTPLYALFYSLSEMHKANFKNVWRVFELYTNKNFIIKATYIDSASKGLLCLVLSAIFAFVMTLILEIYFANKKKNCLLYTSPSPRDLSTSRMPSSA
eukprot:TRINITY_DN23405_c0_g1_i6.p2 TRINITY_DN23405_c0_g1~~TRINITY_DN23405_c0_g1_i6.p2  ORF type:complete len:157 (-),score=40.59 TRINITY_DN23405_c0_g1_i6:144-614(-)